MFAGLVPALSDGFTVITYDQRDCGDSTTFDAVYDLNDLADDVVSLLDRLDLERADLFGQSLGGAIAQLVATRNPERVDRLVLAGTFRAGVSLAAIDPEGFERLLAVRRRADIREAAELFLTASYLEAEPGALDAWKAIAPTTGAEQRARRSAAMQSPIAPVDLTDIAAPTLVVHGVEDQVVPIEHARANAASLAAGHLVELSGVGHAVPLQAPDALATAVLAHLARTDAG